MRRPQLDSFCCHSRSVLVAVNSEVGSGYWLRLPIFGWYTSCGESLDGKGVTPKISVDVDPRKLISGVDQQMEKALEVVCARPPR
jgi:C-terminal processing protease CtpA/Prc